LLILGVIFVDNWEGIKQDLISSRDKFIAKFESGTNMDTIEENWKQFKEAIETCIEKHIFFRV
jgi:hypothetical protein